MAGTARLRTRERWTPEEESLGVGRQAGGKHGAARSEWTKILGPRDLGMKLSSIRCLVVKRSLKRKHIEISRERLKSPVVPGPAWSVRHASVL